jgi:2-desacetyl-2-hydroxyethyl bacteriochlorophyllide A dehydrogenase
MSSTRRLKPLLNKQANAVFARLGHTEAMTRDAKREAWWWLQARAQAARRLRPLMSGAAVVWTAPGRVELVGIEVPLAGPGEVTVEITTSFVSPGTERAQYLRLPNTDVQYPHRTGYSAAGIVIAAGRGASRLRRGDRVAVRNMPHASIVTAPVSSVHPLPDNVTLDAAALVQLGVICGQGVRRACIEEGEPVVVLGAGLIGILAQRIATATGAGSATVIATSRSKERVVTAGGARLLALDESPSAIDAVGAPVVIEATGDPASLIMAVRIAGRNGRIVLLGSARGVTRSVPVEEIRAKSLTVVGAHVAAIGSERLESGEDWYEREAREFLALLADRRLPVGDLVEGVIDPREAEAFYRRLARAHDVIGARFDWTLLDPRSRARRGHITRLPDVSGRGMDLRRPLRMASEREPGAEPPRGRDPFEGASGSLRIGMVGCGDVSGQNAPAIHVAPNTRLVACFDPVRSLAEEVAHDYGAEVTSSAEELFARYDVDAVLLSVPHHLHLPLGADAAAAGKHLIVEKPLANDLRAAAQLVRAAEQSGVVLSVCFPQRFEPGVVRAKKLIASGALGRFAGASIRFFMDKPPSYWVGGYSGRTHSNWRESSEQAGGGVLIMNLSHYLDLLRYLTGEEATLVTAAMQAMDPDAEVEDSVCLTVQYATGAIGSVVACATLIGSVPETELRLWGSDGQLVVEPDAAAYTLHALDGMRTNRWYGQARGFQVDARAVYFSRIATAIDRGDPCDVTAHDGIAIQAMIEAAYRSSNSGSSVGPAALLEEVGFAEG